MLKDLSIGLTNNNPIKFIQNISFFTQPYVHEVLITRLKSSYIVEILFRISLLFFYHLQLFFISSKNSVYSFAVTFFSLFAPFFLFIWPFNWFKAILWLVSCQRGYVRELKTPILFFYFKN